MMRAAAPQAPQAAPMDVRLMNMAALGLAVIAGAAMLVAVGRWALAHPAFGISRIVVQGDTAHHNAITLQANVGSRIAGNFFTLDLAQVRGVFESVPWVRKAMVRREFPNRLRVTIEEHRSLGFWGVDSESRMVNTYGEVFEANAGETEADELPRLVGAEGQSGVMLEMHQQLTQMLQPLEAVVEQLDLSSQGGWTVHLHSGAALELGRGTTAEIQARLQKFLSTYQQVLATYQRTGWDRIETVDLRYGQGYAIRLRGVTTVVNATPEQK